MRSGDARITTWLGADWTSGRRWFVIFIVSLSLGAGSAWLASDPGGPVTRGRLFAAMGQAVQTLWPLLRPDEQRRCALAPQFPDLRPTTLGEQFVLAHHVMLGTTAGLFCPQQTVAPHEAVRLWSRLCQTLEGALQNTPPSLRTWATLGTAPGDWLTPHLLALTAIDALPPSWRAGRLPERPVAVDELAAMGNAVTAYFGRDLLILRVDPNGIRLWAKGAWQRIAWEGWQYAFNANAWQPLPTSGHLERPSDATLSSPLRLFHPVYQMYSATVPWRPGNTLILHLRAAPSRPGTWLPTANAETAPTRAGMRRDAGPVLPPPLPAAALAIDVADHPAATAVGDPELDADTMIAETPDPDPDDPPIPLTSPRRANAATPASPNRMWREPTRIPAPRTPAPHATTADAAAPEPIGWRWGKVVEFGTARPLAEAALMVDGQPRVTDSAGNFMLDEAQRDQLLEITAYQEGYQPLTLKHRAGFAAQGPRLVLQPALATLQGQIRDPSGHRVAGARVTAGDRTTLSGSDGHYMLPGLKPSYQSVRVETADGRGCLETVYLDLGGTRHDFEVATNADGETEAPANVAMR